MQDEFQRYEFSGQKEDLKLEHIIEKYWII